MWSYRKINIHPSSPSCHISKEISGGEGCNAVKVQRRMSRCDSSAASFNRFVHCNEGTNRLEDVNSHRLSTDRRDIDGVSIERLKNDSPTQRLESIVGSRNIHSFGSHQLSTDSGDIDGGRAQRYDIGCASVNINQQK